MALHIKGEGFVILH